MENIKSTINIKSQQFTYKLNVWLFIIIIFEICIYGIYNFSQNKSLMNTVALATTVKPEKYTELYFANHLSLPSSVTQNQTITFAFTIHNMEYQIYNYSYIVYILENGKKTVIDYGHVKLQQNEYKTISESYTVSSRITRDQVVVNLINLNQEIFFWSNEKGINEII